MSKTLVVVLLGIVALACLAVPPLISHAASPQWLTPPPAPHCVATVEEALICFTTLHESLEFASGATLTLEPTQNVSDFSDEDLTNAGILALLYDAPNQVGYSLAIVGDHCGVSGNMPTTWNNRVSSGRTGSCGIYLYDGYNAGGNGIFIAAPGTNYVGDLLNNRASSWVIP